MSEIDSGFVQGEKQKIGKLVRGKEELIASVNNFLDAIGQGLPFNDTVKQRIVHNELRQQEIDAEIACLKRQVKMAAVNITPEMIEHFCSLLREKLRDNKSQFGKANLKILVKEIRLEKQECRITGSSAALIGMVKKTKVDIQDGVATFVIDWLPELDSNQRQAD